MEEEQTAGVDVPTVEDTIAIGLAMTKIWKVRYMYPSIYN